MPNFLKINNNLAKREGVEKTLYRGHVPHLWSPLKTGKKITFFSITKKITQQIIIYYIIFPEKYFFPKNVALRLKLPTAYSSAKMKTGICAKTNKIGSLKMTRGRGKVIINNYYSCIIYLSFFSQIMQSISSVSLQLKKKMFIPRFRHL